MSMLGVNILEFKLWLETIQKFACVMAKFEDPDIYQWIKDNIDENDLYQDEAENGIETDSHVTILYGLHSDNPSDVKKIFKDIKPFEIKLGRINKFTNNPKFDVLKIEIKSQELFKLNSSLRKLDHTQKYSYKPHCTLAYLKKDRANHLVGDTTLFNKKILINKIIFSTKERDKTTINL